MTKFQFLGFCLISVDPIFLSSQQSAGDHNLKKISWTAFVFEILAKRDLHAMRHITPGASAFPP